MGSQDCDNCGRPLMARAMSCEEFQAYRFGVRQTLAALRSVIESGLPRELASIVCSNEDIEDGTCTHDACHVMSALAWHHHSVSKVAEEEKAQEWREQHAHLADFLDQLDSSPSESVGSLDE